MGAGDRIASALAKVAAKVPGSHRLVRLVVERVLAYDPATERKPLPTLVILADLGNACEVRNLSEQKAVALTGSYRAGDREFTIPAANLSESALKEPGAYLLWGDEAYELVRHDEASIDFGVVTQWRVIGRRRG